jgi:putative acetyltransferase
MIRLRRASLEDMPATATLHRLAMTVSLPFLPHLHTPEEDRAYFETQLFPNNAIWLAEEEGTLLGYAAHSPGWLNHLYVHPDHQGRGVGAALMKQVMADDDHLQLWAFQKNERARGFYERRGFELHGLTDGAANEEREPDALYIWTRDHKDAAQ